MLGYPDLSILGINSTILAVLFVLLALALAGSGLWLLLRLWIRNMNNVTADPR